MMLLPRIPGLTLHGDDPLPDRTDYLIGNFIPMKGVGLLVGEPTAGKTFLTIGMAASIASGAPFLGHYYAASTDVRQRPRIVEGGATLILAGEGLDTYGARLTAAYHGLGEQYRQRIQQLGCGDRLPVWWNHAHGLREDAPFDCWLRTARELAEHLEVYVPFGLRLIVIDTLPAVFGFKDENSAAEAQGAISKLVRLSEATGAFVLATMHPRKKSGSRVRGSGVFEGGPDVILTARKGPKGGRTLAVTKSRASAAENETWAYRLVPITLPNGEASAYLDGVVRTSLPSPPTEKPSASERMTRDAADVLAAMEGALRRAPVTWQDAAGCAMQGAEEDAIRAELARIKVPVSPDPRQRRDAERHSYRRGIERLLEGRIIVEHCFRDGRVVYCIQDVGNPATGEG